MDTDFRAQGQRTPPAAAASSVVNRQSKPIVRDGPEPVVRFGPPPDRSDDATLMPTSVSAEEQSFHNRLAGLHIVPVTTLAETCAAVRRTAKHHKHPQRGTFGRGPIPRYDCPNSVTVRIRPHTTQRID
jgi:hypothetical protein